MRFRVSHTTAYRSRLPVVMGYHLAYLTPRDCPGQRVRSHELLVTPTPADRAGHVDVFGNRFTYFCIEEPHVLFEVTATSEVEVSGRRRFADPQADWHSGVERATDPLLADFVAFSDFVTSSPSVRDYAALSFPPGRPLLEALEELNRRIFDDFAYDPGWTTVSTPVEVVFATRRGVCQDFAHLMLACVRSMGLAGRYVSGYLENRPPDGTDALAGADASHAWVSVLSGDGIWIDLDPTNGLVEPAHHITVAWGREYSDVAPLRGVVTAPGDPATLSVAVEVERIDYRSPRRHHRNPR
ncbi:MAG: transglutaminase family protein [Microthrixaceae bacterium]|nr:transglutaminase family protein [Microthrixaceae bacterium]MCO5313938.1 transglutaminase family protein [Microthrixaceae bacterium]HPB45234.1 transglutaminase family protein [Microthrixaceae bacterium]